jgi:phosphoenolpyruvate carboxylase
MTNSEQTNPAPPPDATDAAGRVPRRSDVPDVLRADVRLLGGLLGRVLAESGGQDLLEDVERLRAATIGAYEGAGTASIEDAETIVNALSLQRADEVARAFTCYFHLVNLAEERHRLQIRLPPNRSPARWRH